MVYIKRNIEDKLIKYINSKEIFAVIGPRQSGKTTLINNILDNLNSKMINRLSFDNQKVLNLFEHDIDSFAEMHVKPFDILFIDEIQYSHNSGKLLKYLYDKYNTKFIVSGSSSMDIALNSLSYLVGRVFIFVLYPFNFIEYLCAKNSSLAKIYAIGKFGDEIEKELNLHLKEYSIWGGYPRVVLSKSNEEKKLVLENIYSTYLMKDIKPLFNIKDDFKWLKLVKALSLQIGNLINYNELCNISELDYNTLKQYINILKKSYICNEVPPYYTNKRLELTKAPKIYFYDNGMRNSILNNYTYERTDLGALWENTVFSEMVKKEFYLKYWRSKSGAEVDFLFEKNNTLTPLEIKTTTADNIGKSSLSFIEKYSPKEFYILSENLDATRKIKNTNVNFKPFVKFFASI